MADPELLKHIEARDFDKFQEAIKNGCKPCAELHIVLATMKDDRHYDDDGCWADPFMSMYWSYWLECCGVPLPALRAARAAADAHRASNLSDIAHRLTDDELLVLLDELWLKPYAEMWARAAEEAHRRKMKVMFVKKAD